MTKYRIAELDGALLDAAVALAEGILVTEADEHPSQPGHYKKSREEWGEHIVRWFGRNGEEGGWTVISSWGTPSTEWADGGPIIERERIDLHGGVTEGETTWMARTPLRRVSGPRMAPTYAFEAPTPLIAAMRAYVASKFGEEVELP